MRVHIPISGQAAGHPLTGLVIDGVLAVDAGPLGSSLRVEEQAAIADVLLTHSHMDHVAGLPMFLDNVYQLRPNCPTVHALPHTLTSLQTDVFNDRLMPDFIGLSQTLPPFLRMSEVQPDRPFTAGQYTITPLAVVHTVPTIGYVIGDGEFAVAVVTDTAPVPHVYDRIAQIPRLWAVFLECSFPKRMTDLARLTRHLTTDDFAAAARRFPDPVRVCPIHIKPRYWDEVTDELIELGYLQSKGCVESAEFTVIPTDSGFNVRTQWGITTTRVESVT